jgi:hypothetical protein
MRLIDADALIAEMHNVILEDGEDRRTLYEVIERQPTIEPQIDQNNKELEEARAHIRYLQDQMSRDSGMIEGLKYAIRYHRAGGADMRETE